MSLLGVRGRGVPASPTSALDAAMKAMVAAGEDVVNLGAGETDFDTPAAAAAGAHEAIEQRFTRYTATAGIAPLREGIADWLAAQHGLRYGPGDVVVSNGAKQALHNALLAMLDPGDEVLVPAPYWVSYPSMITLAGGVPVVLRPAPGEPLRLTPEHVERGRTSRTRLLILNNPVNPTGVVYSHEELTAIAETCLRHGILILSDEIYDQQVYPPATFHAVAALDPEIAARTATVGGFSKTFAMTGWRIGYTAAPAELAGAVAAIQGHTTSAPSSISQRAALAALHDPERQQILARQLAELDRRRCALLAAVDDLPGVRTAVHPAGAFYLFADVTALYGKETSAAELAAALLREHGVGVVPGEQFGAPGHIRISYVTEPSRLAVALDRLRTFCAQRSVPVPTT